MAKQITITAYTFDELSDKAKENARQWMREGIDVDWWSDQVTEDAAQVGIKITGWDIGRARAIDLTFEDSAHLSAKRIMEEHGEACDTWEIARGFLQLQAGTQAAYDAGDITEEEANDRHEAETEAFTNEIGEAYLVLLDEAYQDAMYGEGLDETIEANDYLFTEDGSRTAVLNA